MPDPRASDGDCDLEGLKEAVLDGVRAKSAHRLSLRQQRTPVDPRAWQAEAQRLEEAYRSARDAWEECIADVDVRA